MSRRKNPRASKDANHDPVANTFRDLGCSVLDTHLPVVPGYPDLLVGHRGVNYMVEVKNPETAYGRKGLSVSQTDFTASWRGATPILVTSTDEAIALVQHWSKKP